MAIKRYDYNGIIAEYWDLLRGDTSGWSSRPYFLELIRESGEPALDVACGTGRLLLDYMAQGVDIDGVDYAADMIAICRQKAQAAGLAPNLYLQRMEELALPRRYRTIIVPSSSFLHLTDRRDAWRALSRFLAHLEPGGLLAMSMRVFEPETDEEVEWHIDQEAIRPSDGATVRRWFCCSYDVPNRLQSTEDRYEIVKDGQVINSEYFVGDPYLTWYTAGEAITLLQEAGFVDVMTHADFTFEPAATDETSYIVLGKRPLEPEIGHQ
jgi:ubiquinone/menaquinone biosynthesis C-methylase UbiE